ncbi:hypothetical protein SGM_3715 [Streptomyces griseoaurantiacus M045]|uniref:Uncharacterized protein n=1 Tax=Streptomyces griseoaurantiacus M045 TaxID=996637 RepID=F3NKQ1_9ACTN|nr:hypothetical protein SGM_3715 [Streptomyces griseoaurantiacus M045]
MAGCPVRRVGQQRMSWEVRVPQQTSGSGAQEGRAIDLHLLDGPL